MKTRWMHLITGFTMFVLCISVCITTANATVIWEDDFSNPNLPGWTIFAFENRTQVTIEGNFSAADGTLKVLDDDFNVARHNSLVDVGSWCFDMFVQNDGDGWFQIMFMSNGSRPFPEYPSMFVAISASMSHDDVLVWQAFGDDSDIHAEIILDPLQGWYRFKVNRTSGGHFEVYIDGQLRSYFDRNDITNSTYLDVVARNATGCAIDNLIVSDDLNFEPPTTNPTDGGFLIDGYQYLIGLIVAVAIIALVVIFRRRR